MNQLRSTYRVTQTILRRLLLKLLRPFFKKFTGRLYFCYDSSNVFDGVGAQVQRVMAIGGLAAYLGSNYQHSELKNLTTHPMDPFQTPDQRNAFLAELNACICPTICASKSPDNSKFVKIPSLRINQIVYLTIKSLLFDQPYLIATKEVYDIVDCIPSIYALHRAFLEIDFRTHEDSDRSEDFCVHYRRGVGGMVLYHNQSTPRELPLNYYLDAINWIKGTQDVYSVKVLTDSPLIDTVYKVSPDQLHVWENTPGFRSGKLHIKGQNILEDFRGLGLEVEIVVGGDPIKSLGILQSAKILLMSKSSFSYVAALLNEGGEIYFPDGFWHPKQSSWKLVK